LWVDVQFQQKCFEFVIYNRYGQKLFQTNTTQTGWDGTFNNQKQPVGVYVWILNYVQSNGTNAKISTIKNDIFAQLIK